MNNTENEAEDAGLLDKIFGSERLSEPVAHLMPKDAAPPKPKADIELARVVAELVERVSALEAAQRQPVADWAADIIEAYWRNKDRTHGRLTARQVAGLWGIEVSTGSLSRIGRALRQAGIKTQRTATARLFVFE